MTVSDFANKAVFREHGCEGTYPWVYRHNITVSLVFRTRQQRFVKHHGHYHVPSVILSDKSQILELVAKKRTLTELHLATYRMVDAFVTECLFRYETALFRVFSFSEFQSERRALPFRFPTINNVGVIAVLDSYLFHLVRHSLDIILARKFLEQLLCNCHPIDLFFIITFVVCHGVVVDKA